MTTWVAPLPEAAGPKERPQRAGARAARRRRRGRQRHAAPRRRAPSYCGQPTAAAAAWACSPPVFGRAAWCWPARAAAHASESAVAMSVETRGFWREQAHQDADLSQGSKRAALAASSACVASCVPNYKFRAPAARRTSCRRRRAKNGCDGLWGRPDETCARCSAPAAPRRRRILGRVVPRGESSSCRVRAPAAVRILLRAGGFAARILRRRVSGCESCCAQVLPANPTASVQSARIPEPPKRILLRLRVRK